MWEVGERSWVERERHETWEGIHEGALRLNRWLEMKVWIVRGIELKVIERSVGEVEWLEIEDEDWNHET